MQFDQLKRREFITVIGGAAVAWPLTARAQQPTMPVVGFLSATSSEMFETRLRGFRQGLKESGFVEGENVVIIYHWADEQYDRLPELANNLVRRQVAVIATVGGPASSAAKAGHYDNPHRICPRREVDADVDIGAAGDLSRSQSKIRFTRGTSFGASRFTRTPSVDRTFTR
jgi:ABC-type uncharacterized transport system substrate-binding protein